MDKREKKYMMTPIFLALTVVILIVTGQVLWKLGVTGKIHSFDSFLAALTSPLVIIGAIVYILAAIIWIFMLSKYQYHFIYPLLSLSFILALIASRFIFHEEFSWLSWLGVGIICLGIILIGLANK